MPRLRRETTIGDVTVRASSVDVRSVGAGGGSVAWLDQGGLLRMGPASAGADPGPACYGRGGTEPTVTDANVMVGKVQPKFFPSVFGPEANRPLDAEVVRGHFAKLATQTGRAAANFVRISAR